MAEFKHSHRLINQGWVDGMVIYNWEDAAKIYERVRKFTTRPDDLFVCSYPKTGTTWTQNIVWYVTHPEDLEQGAIVDDHFSFLEMSKKLSDGKYFIDRCEAASSPRYIKTHLPVRYFAEAISAKDAPKYIACLRNPKDTLVSLYNFYQTNSRYGNFTQGWDEFFKLYEAGETVNGDMLDHFAGWWKLKDRENVLVLMYEDMKKDPEQSIRDVATFLGQSLTDDQVKAIAEKTSFEKMKLVGRKGDKGPNTKSSFFRKGVVGDWKNNFNEAQSRRIDEDVAEKLAPLGLHFKYD